MRERALSRGRAGRGSGVSGLGRAAARAASPRREGTIAAHTHTQNNIPKRVGFAVSHLQFEQTLSTGQSECLTGKSECIPKAVSGDAGRRQPVLGEEGAVQEKRGQGARPV